MANRESGSIGQRTLRALSYPKVRMDDASVIKWGNRSELPIENDT